MIQSEDLPEIIRQKPKGPGKASALEKKEFDGLFADDDDDSSDDDERFLMKHERTKPSRRAAAAVAALDDSDEDSDVQYRCVTLVRL